MTVWAKKYLPIHTLLRENNYPLQGVYIVNIAYATLETIEFILYIDQGRTMVLNMEQAVAMDLNIEQARRISLQV